MIIQREFTIEEFKGTNEFVVSVEAEIITGGSNSHGSDEPEWIECDIRGIYNPRRYCKKLSETLTEALLHEYGEWFEDCLIEEGEDACD